LVAEVVFLAIISVLSRSRTINNQSFYFDRKPTIPVSAQPLNIQQHFSSCQFKNSRFTVYANYGCDSSIRVIRTYFSLNRSPHPNILIRSEFICYANKKYFSAKNEKEIVLLMLVDVKVARANS
jgi:hypothetical protein